MGRRGAGTRGSSPTGRPRQQSAQRKQGRGATYSVAVMTIASLVGVGVLAAQAAATAPRVSNSAGAKTGGKGSGQPTASSSATSAPDPTALPAGSGSGARIVYGQGAKRVWLVSSANAVVRSFVVIPGTIPAPSGSYSVTNKLSAVTGTDNTPVQYVVLFAKIRYNGSSTALGFDAVANVTGLPPAPTAHTGGIRMAQIDAQALWSFSSLGTKVVVVS